MSLERNIRLAYITNTLAWGRFYIPVLALFYVASKVSVKQFTIIMAVFSLTILLFELPSGVISDLIGRKKTLIVAYSCFLVEIIIISVCNGFWPFLVAKVISGIGVSLVSGTGSALLFESLKKLKRVDEHKKISGKVSMTANISSAVVFIIGGVLFQLHYKLPAYVSLPFAIASLACMFFLVEPYPPLGKVKRSHSIAHLKESIRLFMRNGKLKFLFVYYLPVIAVCMMVLNFSSLYFELVRIPLYLIGVVAFVSSMVMAISSRKADAIDSWFGEKMSLPIAQVVLMISLFLLGLMIPYWGVLFYLLVPLSMGFVQVSVMHRLNVLVSSKHRATMLSINNLGSNFAVFVFFPLAGTLAKTMSMSIAMYFLLLIVILGVFALSIVKHRFAHIL